MLKNPAISSSESTNFAVDIVMFDDLPQCREFRIALAWKQEKLTRTKDDQGSTMFEILWTKGKYADPSQAKMFDEKPDIQPGPSASMATPK